jgi:glutamine synthetase
VTVTGEYPEPEQEVGTEDSYSGTLDPDCVLVPDPNSICVAPGYRTPTAYVVTDAYTHAGKLIDIAPRQVLRRVLDLYAEKGWQPVVAPEVEFFLTARNIDPDLPLETPVGRSGRAETVSQPYGLEAINEYEDLIEQIYEYCAIGGKLQPWRCAGAGRSGFDV